MSIVLSPSNNTQTSRGALTEILDSTSGSPIVVDTTTPPKFLGILKSLGTPPITLS